MTIPQIMQAWHPTGHGGPERLAWREDVPVPGPATGAGETAAEGIAGGAAGGRDGALGLPRIQGADRFRPAIAARASLHALPDAQAAFPGKAPVGKIAIEVSP